MCAYIFNHELLFPWDFFASNFLLSFLSSGIGQFYPPEIYTHKEERSDMSDKSPSDQHVTSIHPWRRAIQCAGTFYICWQVFGPSSRPSHLGLQMCWHFAFRFLNCKITVQKQQIKKKNTEIQQPANLYVHG